MKRSPIVLAVFAAVPFAFAIACGGPPKPTTSPDDIASASAASTDTSAPTDMASATSTAVASATAPASSTANVPPPPPSKIDKSKLTFAQLQAAQKAASPNAAYDATMEKVSPKLGPAQRTFESTSYWYAISGKDCVELGIEKAGDKIGAVGITKGYKKNDKVSLKDGSTFRPWDYCEGK